MIKVKKQNCTKQFEQHPPNILLDESRLCGRQTYADDDDNEDDYKDDDVDADDDCRYDNVSDQKGDDNCYMEVLWMIFLPIMF